MKTLYLLRHAKSDWGEGTLSDVERPLNPRGQRDAPQVGQRLAQRFAPFPQFCSCARRASDTLDAVLDNWPAAAALPREQSDSLYTFQAGDLLHWLQQRPASLDGLMLVGHNPALTVLTCLLVGEPVVDNLPTAGFVALSLSIDDWAEAGPGCAALDALLRPKDFHAQ